MTFEVDSCLDGIEAVHRCRFISLILRCLTKAEGETKRETLILT